MMGIDKINFPWYLKNIRLLALLDFFTGLAAYLLQQGVTSQPYVGFNYVHTPKQINR